MTTEPTVKGINLPLSRHSQLRELAHVRGKSMSEVIGDFIREAIANGEIQDEVPGIKISMVKGQKLSLFAPGFGATLQAKNAKTLAEVLKSLSSSQAKDMAKLRAVMKPLSMTARRQGSAVLLENSAGEKMTFSASVATDVATRIEKELSDTK